MAKTIWTHPKIKGNFTSSYEVFTTLKTKVKERIFMLTSEKSPKNGAFRKISYESWQAAVDFGWKKKDKK